MQVEITGHVTTTGDCGHKIDVPVGRIEEEFYCPECGATDRFTPEQIDGIKDRMVKQASDVGLEKVRESLSKIIGEAVAGSKHIKHTPGRKDG